MSRGLSAFIGMVGMTKTATQHARPYLVLQGLSLQSGQGWAGCGRLNVASRPKLITIICGQAVAAVRRPPTQIRLLHLNTSTQQPQTPRTTHSNSVGKGEAETRLLTLTGRGPPMKHPSRTKSNCASFLDAQVSLTA
jgi:hypothetical protein